MINENVFSDLDKLINNFQKSVEDYVRTEAYLRELYSNIVASRAALVEYTNTIHVSFTPEELNGKD
jgi:hypothetical protein